jgi:hypothetical protein
MLAGYPVQVRLQPEELSAVDEYRRSYANPPSRGEAVRRLTRTGLKYREADKSEPFNNLKPRPAWACRPRGPTAS